MLSSMALAASKEVMKATAQVSGGLSSVSGTVIPVKEAALSAQIPGIVNYLGGKAGDSLTKGAVLFTIDPASILAKRQAAMAAYQAALSGFRNAQIQYNKELYSPRTGQPTGMGMPSMMDSFMKPFSGQYAGPHNPWAARQANLQSRMEGIEGARTQLMRVQAQIKGIDTKLNDAQIRAPFDGVIVSKSIEVGDTVQPGQPLMKFADTTLMQIKAEIPERLMSSIKVGKTIDVRIDTASVSNLKVKVNQIYPVANKTRHTVTVKLDLPVVILGKPVHEVLRAGMYAEVLLLDTTSASQNLPVIPRTAVITDGPLPVVYTCIDKRRASRYVTVGGETTGDKVTIISGIKVGDWIVIDPEASNKATVCSSVSE